jgi:putative flippase GtrA
VRRQLKCGKLQANLVGKSGTGRIVTEPNPGLLSRLTKHVPPGQLGRYLVVGIWNTAFGYGTYAAFTALLYRYGKDSYLAAMVLSSLINITVAFLGYKWFVFKTKGNYLREWFRCLSVYGGSMLISFVTLPSLVFALRKWFGYERGAPYLAGAILTGATVVISFFGHKHISFRQSKKPAETPGD